MEVILTLLILLLSVIVAGVITMTGPKSVYAFLFRHNTRHCFCSGAPTICCYCGIYRFGWTQKEENTKHGPHRDKYWGRNAIDRDGDVCPDRK